MEYIAHKETHRGIEIEIVQDDCHHSCPMEDGDCYQPMIVIGTGQIGEDIIQPPLDHMTDIEVMANCVAIINCMDGDHEAFHQSVRDEAEQDDWPFPTPEHFRRVAQEAYDGWFTSDLRNIDKAEAEKIAALYRIAGVPARVFSFHGHCKGDYRTILVIETEGWRQRVGAPVRDLTSNDPQLNGDDDMRGTAQTYADWAFGDVYGYTVTDPTTGEKDSCWGFIGSYMSDGWNYLIEQAREAADGLADDRDSEIAATITATRPDLYQLAA